MVRWRKEAMLSYPTFSADSDEPIYRQLYEHIRSSIEAGTLRHGDRLPPTRELAGQLGLNRTTVSSAYELLESEGFVSGQVGRGSFVTAGARFNPAMNWDAILPAADPRPSAPEAGISFSNSRPSEFLFPVDAFRATCSEVMQSAEMPQILQLGSPAGYAPLRRYLLESSRREGVARDGDDILVTSGCQQAFDLLQRILAAHGETVVLEDPVYPGLRSVFSRAGANVLGIPVTANGIDVEQAERVFSRQTVRMAVVTPNFQNPTGATMPLEQRRRLLDLCRRTGVVLVENDIYGDLIYEGAPEPAIRSLDGGGDTVLLRSFSKLAFPGLRTGWAIGPARLIARLTEAKQFSDLHTDQLSQAVLLRFAESGRLAEHTREVRESGRQRLRAALKACENHFPPGTQVTRPRGGMNLWVRLPEPLDAGELLSRAVREGVSYTPGRWFAVSRTEPGSLRLSFASLAPERITEGIRTLGRIFTAESEKARECAQPEPAPALV
jgi:2-aminoadipate transaminase